ncbi:MAG: DUF296 domain-containing protein [Patescibacteria group bacterium]|nr:DUF296 domain-containing protein [Patescibacteria group bacterium]
MKIVLHEGNNIILRIDRGEEVFERLISYIRESGITAGTFSGIGAASRIVISYYNLETNTYQKSEVIDVEIVSLNGNIGILGDEPALHAHGVFSGSDMVARGGHVHEITISGTCELRIDILSGELRRSRDENTGLNLFI